MPSQITPPVEDRIARIMTAYADHPEGSVPTKAQWDMLAGLPDTATVALINHFRFREHAVYPDGRATELNGHEAFGLYTAVSGDALTRAGGHFLMMSLPAGTLIGDDAHWDLVAIGQYQNPQGIFAIFEDPEYRDCFIHRTAALAAQRVSLCTM